MMPTPWDGIKWWTGKKNPVTLVATVVVKNSAVQPSSRFPEREPEQDHESGKDSHQTYRDVN